jgi:SAM-dependent methyltransferase
MRYGRRFFNRQSARSETSARAVIPVVVEILGTAPHSVLDVGCGVGTWLAVWQEQQGVSEILGVDGHYVQPSQLRIPARCFKPWNLSNPLEIGTTFDLVQSLEVAEHLQPHAAVTMVESLIRHGNVILFSAAVPGQSGKGHVNERRASYWVECFASYSYQVFDIVRWRIWDRSEIGIDYRQNLMIFASQEGVERVENRTVDRSLDVVHPDMLDSFSVRRTITTASSRLGILRRH